MRQFLRSLVVIAIASLTLSPRSVMSQAGRVEYLNPAGMRKNPAFTNVVVATGPVKTIYIGALDPVDATPKLVGRGDIGAQTEQLFKNLQIALEAAGAKMENVVHWRIYVLQGQAMQPAFQVFQRAWGNRPNPPANTVIIVPAFEPGGILINMEVTAVVPL
jgi:enamine deaminase RidA (YjgF/YER057c/UK114 family)